MAKECMLVRHSLLTALQALGDAERGRLFTAMLIYSMGGEEAEGCSGNERIIWPIAKEMIDTDTATYKKKVSARWGNDTSGDNTRQQVTSSDNSRPPNPNPKSNPKSNPKANIISPDGESKRAKRFTPPTPDEVAAYCCEKGYGVDPDRFCDYYASKGWVVGKSPMKDWRAAVRSWVSKDKKKETFEEMVERITTEDADELERFF